MTYLHYRIVKLLVMAVVVGVWQFWRGLNGLPFRTDQDHIIKARRRR